MGPVALRGLADSRREIPRGLPATDLVADPHKKKLLKAPHQSLLIQLACHDPRHRDSWEGTFYPSLFFHSGQLNGICCILSTQSLLLRKGTFYES